MKLFIDKSKCRIEEAPNGAVLTIETELPIIVQDEVKRNDFLLLQRLAMNGKEYRLPSPVVIGSIDGLEI